MDNGQQLVYVALLGEGTDVWRPAPARHLGGDLYELLETPDYDPCDEEWQFAPLTRVRCKLDESGLLKAVQQQVPGGYPRKTAKANWEDETAAKQRNTLPQDILRNNSSVDNALWNGLRKPSRVQRAGTVAIGLLLVLCGIASAATANKQHYLFEIVLTLAFLGAGIKVMSNAFRRRTK